MLHRTYLLFLGFQAFDFFSTSFAENEKWMRQIGWQCLDEKQVEGNKRSVPTRRACRTIVQYDIEGSCTVRTICVYIIRVWVSNMHEMFNAKTRHGVWSLTSIKIVVCFTKNELLSSLHRSHDIYVGDISFSFRSSFLFCFYIYIFLGCRLRNTQQFVRACSPSRSSSVVWRSTPGEMCTSRDTAIVPFWCLMLMTTLLSIYLCRIELWIIGNDRWTIVWLIYCDATFEVDTIK